MSLIDVIAEKLQLSATYIKNIEQIASLKYKMYKIPKKNGTYRVIYHPSQELKTLQYWIKYYIFNHLPISEFSTAYSKGCSIKRNAMIHHENKFFLHIDLKDFFESIKKQHVVNLLTNNANRLNALGMSLSKRDIDFICNICLRYNHLTIGSVSSPTISNCVMYDYDLAIKQKIPDNIIFTRYADDLIFSSKDFIDTNIINEVKIISRNFSFNLNDTKTYFMSTSGRISVTGLIINNGKLSIGLKRRRYIKSLLYNKLVKGHGDSRKILGYLFFLKDIEPKYFNKIILKYSYLGNVIELLKNDHSINNNADLSTIEAAAAIPNIDLY